jgi:hypothetical protein
MNLSLEFSLPLAGRISFLCLQNERHFEGFTQFHDFWVRVSLITSEHKLTVRGGRARTTSKSLPMNSSPLEGLFKYDIPHDVFYELIFYINDERQIACVHNNVNNNTLNCFRLNTINLDYRISKSSPTFTEHEECINLIYLKKCHSGV